MSGALGILACGQQSGMVNQSLPNGSGINAGVVSWTLSNDGTYTISTGQTGSWVTPATSAIAALYEAQVTVTSGSFSAGTTGSYLDLSTSRTWSRSDPPPPGVANVVFNVSIREKATGVVRNAQTGLTLEATAF